MPNTASAKKRLRQNQARRVENRSKRAAIRTQIRRLREVVAAGDKEGASAQFKVCAKVLDRAGARGLIHKNAAARTKSRLNKLTKSIA